MSARVAMISGASRGIGAAIAAELLAGGWHVSLGLREPSGGPSEGANTLKCRFDALDPSSEEEWLEATLSRFGRLDAFVHSAGIMIPKGILDSEEKDVDRILAVNLRSPLRLSRLAWPYLEQGPGRVLFLSSLSGKRIKSASSGLYGVSKFAVTGLAHALRQCGRESRVRVTALCPGFVATEMAHDLTDQPPGELTQTADIARIARLVLELPSTASIAEIPVNWTVDDSF